MSLATEETLEALFHWRNVDDDLTEGFSKAFNQIAEQGTALEEMYSEKAERWSKSCDGICVQF